MKISKIEENIMALQRKIQMLEESSSSVHDEIEEDLAAFSLPAPTPMPRSIINPTKNTMVSKASFAPVVSTYVGQDEVMKEIDDLRQNDHESAIKIETLNYRCEGLQAELTSKVDTLNKTLIEIEEKNNMIAKLTSQNKLIESEIENQRKVLLPEHQKLKSQHAVALLELKSLENDNGVLERRIKELSNANNSIKLENREMKVALSKTEQDRFQLKKEIEILKLEFSSSYNDQSDLKEKLDSLKIDGQRLKNELQIAGQKLAIFTSGNVEKPVKNFDVLDMPERRERPIATIIPGIFTASTQKKAHSPKPASRSNFLSQGEKLNFEGLNSLENDLKRISK